MSTSSPRNWGRWGETDERGAANQLTAASVREAASLVNRGEVIALGQLLDAATPVPAGRPSPVRYMTRDGGDYAAGARLLGRSQIGEDVLTLGTHTGTHIDSLAHVWYEEHLYNGFPQSTVRSAGASRCGIDKLGPLVARGVLLDVAARAGELGLSAEHAISAEDLQAAADAANVSVAAGDVVLVRTGWLGRAGDEPGLYWSGEPGLDLTAAQWLAERDVVAVGADNYAVEVLDGKASAGFPVHELLIRDCGIPLIEGLVLDELADNSAGAFLFVALPLPLRGGTASPVNPVAIV
jgi:kynurenine formamidase